MDLPDFTFRISAISLPCEQKDNLASQGRKTMGLAPGEGGTSMNQGKLDQLCRVPHTNPLVQPRPSVYCLAFETTASFLRVLRLHHFHASMRNVQREAELKDHSSACGQSALQIVFLLGKICAYGFSMPASFMYYTLILQFSALHRTSLNTCCSGLVKPKPTTCLISRGFNIRPFFSCSSAFVLPFALNFISDLLLPTSFTFLHRSSPIQRVFPLDTYFFCCSSARNVFQ